MLDENDEGGKVGSYGRPSLLDCLANLNLNRGL